MMTAELERAAGRNLVGTYFRLANATPRVQVWQEQGFRVCVGDFEHPICNFAADLDLDEKSADRLFKIAAGKPTFHVYVLPGDQPSNVTTLLVDSGFRSCHTMVQMVASPRSSGDVPGLREARSLDERGRIARFMTEQFFSRQDAAFRRRVVDTTTAVTDLPLYALEDRGRIVGAFMLSIEQSVVGLYNLCVAAPSRRRGWGTMLVQAALNLAADHRQEIVLQCAPSLRSWYSDRTFRSAGAVECYDLPKSPGLAIMDRV